MAEGAMVSGPATPAKPGTDLHDADTAGPSNRLGDQPDKIRPFHATERSNRNPREAFELRRLCVEVSAMRRD